MDNSFAAQNRSLRIKNVVIEVLQNVKLSHSNSLNNYFRKISREIKSFIKKNLITQFERLTPTTC